MVHFTRVQLYLIEWYGQFHKGTALFDRVVWSGPFHKGTALFDRVACPFHKSKILKALLIYFELEMEVFVFENCLFSFEVSLLKWLKLFLL